MTCKYKNRLNDYNFCLVACAYCTLEQELTCKRKITINDNVPTVDIKTEVKHGEWIDVPLLNNPRRKPNKKCSLCGRVVRREENYCPRCGAKMRGE